jgi:tetrahydromethanopterin S-methyltransferase subunit G
MDRIDDLFLLVTDMRGEMTRRFEGLDQKVDRDFRWLVGLQMTMMVTVVGVLLGAYFGQ